MSRIRAGIRIAFTAAVTLCAAAGSVIHDVTLNTSQLVGHAAGPFSLEFQLNDGSGTGDANNTVTLTDFVFDTGGPAGSPALVGGASGNALSGVALTDSAFFNEFVQPFTPGSQLRFRMTITTNLDAGGTPDLFTFAILDSGGAELPTQSFFDVFALVDIDSPNPAVHVFGSDPSRAPAVGGSPLTIPEPEVSGIPEPGSLVLATGGLLALVCIQRRRWLVRARL